MANVVAFDDVKHTRAHRIVDGGASAWRTNYMNATDEQPEQPVAFLAECGPQRVLRTHFHQNDQFQIFVSGGGHAGKHPIKPFQVHFARAHTPYGPIVAKDHGVAFLTLRTRKDPGAQYLPEKRDVLVNVEGRKPWQLTSAVEFPEAKGAISMKPLEGMVDDQGLAGQAITMQANAVARGPDCSKSNGQYIVVLGGSLMHEGREHKATTIIFVEPKDGTFELHAGPEGLQAVALNFPRTTKTGPEHSDAKSKEAHAAEEFKVWQCVLCAFVYDEAAGLPDEGIAPGTRWKDVPESWGCPDCSATKNDFEMVEI